MRWDDFRSSDNVEDRRGGGGGGGFGIPMGGGGLGIGAIIVLTLAGWALGIDPRILIGAGESMMGGGAPQEQTQRAPQGRTGAPPDDRAGQFAAKVLGNTEDVWKVVLPEQVNKPYAAPKMVIYSGATRSRCGGARSQMGPFYCPIDQTVYIDLSFFQEMQRKFRAGGDFAYAYVIAHEVGHHVQNQLG
ncbi:MAG: neutral zinc metallopeptidase, partial [Microvirga sp.]